MKYLHLFLLLLHPDLFPRITGLAIGGIGMEPATTSSSGTSSTSRVVRSTDTSINGEEEDLTTIISSSTPKTPEEDQPITPHELSVDPNSDFTKHPNFDLLPNMEDCGLAWDTWQQRNKTRKKRVVGGKLAKLGKYPWLGRLELYEGGSGNSTERCGSSLINSRYVLTAAHCVTRIPSGHSVSKVAFGTTDIRKTRECIPKREDACSERKKYEIEEIIIHEDYITGSLLNDIALIRLTEPVKYNAFINPICLPRDEALLKKWKDSKLTVAGFGRSNGDDDNNTHYPNHMHEVDLPIVGRRECETFYRRKTGPLDTSRFCAGGEPEKGDCRGDSGGPLMKKLPIDELANVTRTVQFGLVSYGHCALEGVPGGYINILYYMPWILDNIEP